MVKLVMELEFLIEIPDEFFRKECNFVLPDPKTYAVGMVFLPQKINQMQFCIKIFEEEIQKRGLSIIGWRDVPVNAKVVGKIAALSQPAIKQVFVTYEDKSLSENEFNTQLFVARKSENKILKLHYLKKLFLFFKST